MYGLQIGLGGAGELAREERGEENSDCEGEGVVGMMMMMMRMWMAVESRR